MGWNAVEVVNGKIDGVSIMDGFNFTVYDWDRFTKPDKIGECFLHPHDLFSCGISDDGDVVSKASCGIGNFLAMDQWVTELINNKTWNKKKYVPEVSELTGDVGLILRKR